MKFPLSLVGGLAGACALTLIHEVLRRKEPNSPRMDLLGMNALAKLMRQTGVTPPAGNTLFNLTMAGDIGSNALYYSLVGTGSRSGIWARGLALGVAAGAGAVLLPGKMGLPEAPSNRTPETKLMTVGLYTAGGLVTAAVTTLLNRKFSGEPEEVEES